MLSDEWTIEKVSEMSSNTSSSSCYSKFWGLDPWMGWAWASWNLGNLSGEPSTSQQCWQARLVWGGHCQGQPREILARFECLLGALWTGQANKVGCGSSHRRRLASSQPQRGAQLVVITHPAPTDQGLFSPGEKLSSEGTWQPREIRT